MRTIALVPARLESTRLEKKLLRLISDTPLVVLTAKNLLNSKLFNEVCVVTDSDEIIEVLKKYSIRFFKSSKHYETGTDRISEFVNNFNCDLIINVQGDEPFINKSDLNLIIQNFKEDYKNEIEATGIPSQNLQGTGAVFLLDSGKVGETAPMVQIFMDKMKQYIGLLICFIIIIGAILIKNFKW